MKSLIRRTALGLAFIVPLLTAACSTVDPVTGRKVQNMYLIEDDIQMGREVMAETVKTMRDEGVRLNANKKKVKQVEEIVRNIAAVSHLPDLPYEVVVFETNIVNAAAAPGGQLMVFSGLYDPEDGLVADEDELAAVLAHEIGHVEKVHGLRAIKTGRLNSALTILAVEAGKNLAGEQLAEVTKAFDESINDIAGTLMNSGYSRKLEYEADAAAVAILKQAGYTPGALVAMLENMAKNWDSSRKDFAATHPAPADRINELQKIGVTSSKASAAARQQRFLAATKSL